MARSRLVTLSDPWAEYNVLASRNVSGLSSGERRLLAVGGLRTEVNNGGFHQYFVNSAGDLALEAESAARQVSADSLAMLVRRAIDLVGDIDIGDRDARQEALDNIDPDVFEELDDAFFALEESIDLDVVMQAVR